MTTPATAPKTAHAGGDPPRSPNFDFLDVRYPLLIRYAAPAERYLFADPVTAFF